MFCPIQLRIEQCIPITACNGESYRSAQCRDAEIELRAIYNRRSKYLARGCDYLFHSVQQHLELSASGFVPNLSECSWGGERIGAATGNALLVRPGRGSRSRTTGTTPPCCLPWSAIPTRAPSASGITWPGSDNTTETTRFGTCYGWEETTTTFPREAWTCTAPWA